MKDLTEYFNTENFYKDVYGDQFSKSLIRDIKRSKLKKRVIFLLPIAALVVYFGILLLTGTVIGTEHFIMALGMIGMQVPGMLSLKLDIKKFKDSANTNLQELIRLLFQKGEDVNYDSLQNSIVTHKKEKEKIEYREVETNKKVINHVIKTEETNVYFKNIEEQLRCLREMRQIVTFQDIKEETHTLELLEEHEIDENEVPAKVRKKLKQ